MILNAETRDQISAVGAGLEHPPRQDTLTFFQGSALNYGNYLDEVWTIDKRSGGVTVADLNDGTGSDRHFYHCNTLYSVYALTDEAGAIAEAAQSYDSYGKISALITGAGSDGNWFTSDDVLAANPNVSAIGNPWFYTGQRIDPETGLQFSKNRYLSVDLGRWISRDPIGYMGGIGLYEYSAGSATTSVDPLGLNGLKYKGYYKYGAIDGEWNPSDPKVTPNASTANDYKFTWLPPIGERTPETCNPGCQEVGFIQIVRDAKKHWKKPSEEFVGGWKRDVLKGSGPAYDDDSENRWSSSSPATSAILRDTPGVSGEPSIMAVGWATEKYEYFYETCAVCMKGSEAGTVYCCTIWSHSWTYSKVSGSWTATTNTPGGAIGALPAGTSGTLPCNAPSKEMQKAIEGDL